MASERLSGDERELLYAIAQQATALAGGTMNTEAHDERELLAEIELQLRTLVESGGGGTPGGSDTQIQYNNAGAFGGVAGMTYVPPDISIVGDAAAHGTTGGVTIASGESTDDADAGNITIQAADGGANGGAPGSLIMTAGSVSTGISDGGSFYMSAGDGDSGNGGGFSMSGGDSLGGDGGRFQMTGGDSSGATGGSFIAAGGGGYAGGAVEMAGGDGEGGDGGGILVRSGNGTSGDANGGDVTLQPGNGTGTGRNGLLLLNNLPTSDPVVAGAVWNDAGVLKISAG